MSTEIKEKEIHLGDDILYRIPEFDVEVRTIKSSAFSRFTQNETIAELFKMGLFSPEKKDEALIALDALELEGKNKHWGGRVLAQSGESAGPVRAAGIRNGDASRPGP